MPPRSRRCTRPWPRVSPGSRSQRAGSRGVHRLRSRRAVARFAARGRPGAARQPAGAAGGPPGRRDRARAGAARRPRGESTPDGWRTLFAFPLSIPGEVRLDNRAGPSAAERRRGCRERPAAPVRQRAVRRGRGGEPSACRWRSARGGRATGSGRSGLGHRKKLQDFLVDRKIPREMRDSLPLVVDGEDRIVWVVGRVRGRGFSRHGPSQGVILLKARRLGGVG